MQNLQELQAPPHDKDAEAAVLGSIMLAQDSLHEIGHLLRPESFYDERHRWIFRGMVALDDEGGKVDVITLADWLADQGALERIGGPSIMARLSNAVPSAANINSYAQTVRELYQRRQLLAESRRVAIELQGREIDAETAVGKLQDVVERASADTVDDKDVSMRARVHQWYNRLERIIDGDEEPGWSTGIQMVDDLLGGGIKPQRMYGIAALPKMGKSKLANVIAGHLAFEHDFAVDWWYTDGAGEAVAQELIAWKAKVSTRHLEQPTLLSEQEMARVTRWAPEVMKIVGNVYDKGTPNVRDIVMRTKARLAKLEGRPMLLVVDYLQNCTAGYSGPDSERMNVLETSRKLAALRTDHPNLVVLALMQFNRRGAQKSIPQPHDLHGSSQIEKDLNHLLILHRPAELDEEATQDDKRKGILWHALSKHNQSDMKQMFCDLSTNTFGAFDEREFRYGH